MLHLFIYNASKILNEWIDRCSEILEMTYFMYLASIGWAPSLVWLKFSQKFKKK